MNPRTHLLRALLLGLVLFSSPALAQTRTIGLVAKAQSDRILLRWTPDSSLLWQQANQYGYLVLRKTISRNGIALTGTSSVTLNTGGTPIRPLATTDPFWSAVALDSAYRRAMRDLLYASDPAQPPVDTVDSVTPRLADLPFYRYVNALMTADQSFASAVAAGLGFVDGTAQSNERYEYRIATAIPPAVLTTSSQVATLGLVDYRTLSPPERPALRFGVQTATVNWRADTVATGYNTYWIERSGNGTTFTARNRQPFLIAGQQQDTFFYQDSLPRGRRTYYYRLLGKTIFDETAYSAVVFGQSKDTVLNVPAIQELQIDPTGAARLRWQFPGDTLVAGADTLLRSFFVAVAGRAGERPVPARVGLPPTSTTAVVSNYRTKAPDGATYYFTVGAVRLDGDTLLSAPVFVEPLDTIPPTTPTGLRGLITTGGVGSLSWRPSPEPDLLGYKVFRAQRAGEEPSAVTGDSILAASAWLDPVALNFLNAGVYYQVRAIDRRYNQSPLSEPLYLTKPDTIRPSAPLFRRYALQPTGVRLVWFTSFSPDVTRHLLYRRDRAGGPWQQAGAFARQDTAYVDADARAARSYEYLLLAEDAGGLLSDSSARLLIELPASRGGQPSVLAAFSGQSNPDRRAISLNWSYDAPGVAEFQLYRAVGNRSLRQWRMVSGLETTTDDADVQPDTTYRYSLRASFRDGTLSNWQNLTITYRNTATAAQPPYVALPIGSQTATVGQTFSFTVPAATFADADNDIVRVSLLPAGLPAGLVVSGSAVTGQPQQPGQFTVTAEAQDSQGLKTATQFTLTVNAPPALLAPLPALTVTVGESFAYTLPTRFFTDEGGGAVAVTILTTDLPTSLTATGPTLSGVLSSPGPFSVAVQATDAAGVSRNTSFQLVGNRPPQLVGTLTSQTALLGQYTTWTLPNGLFTDPESQSVTVALLGDGLPSGLASTGRGYQGTPTGVGSYTLIVRATDSRGAVSEVPLRLSVLLATNVLPVVTAPLGGLTLLAGQPADYRVPTGTFFDEDGEITRIVLGGSVPGLVLTDNRLGGTPTQSGSYTLTVTATDNRGGSVSTPLSIWIPAAPAPPLLAGSTSVCTGQSATLTASGCVGGEIQWSTGSTGQSLIVSPVQTSTYTATCQRDGLTSAVSSAVTVVVNALPTASIAGSPVICSGQPASLTASGGTSYRWSGPVSATTAVFSTTLSGSYSLTVTQSSGCWSATTTTITSSTAPVPLLATSNSPLITGQSLNLSASSFTGATYTWTGPGSFTATGHTPAIQPVTLANAGQYTVRATGSNGCSATASTTVTVTTLTSYTTCIEAENTTLTSGNGTLSADAAASGGQRMGVYSTDTEFRLFQFNNIANAGAHTLRIRYLAPASGQAGIRLNGATTPQLINLPATTTGGAVTGSYGEVTVSVSLVLGNNSIRIQGVSGAGSFYVDRICIQR